MRIIEELSNFSVDIQTVVTNGIFDGVHLGHEKILKQVSDLAKSRGQQSVVITYWPHPRFVLNPNENDGSLKLLSTFEEKSDQMAICGIDYLVKIPFTQKFSQMRPDFFVRKVLKENLNTSSLVIGYDHHFGKDREGNFEYLQTRSSDFGLELIEIPRHDIENVSVSSTKIREALLDGEVDQATRLLGRPYAVKGLVVHGDKKGRSLGYPTANLWIPEKYKLIPADGSYATKVNIEGKMYGSMTNIGIRPTIDGAVHKIETNIFNFDGQLYGKNLKLQFIMRLRDEMRFSGVHELKTQLARDKIETIKILNI